ncbi:DCN1-like protein 4-like isoform X1 [Mucor ambiguus]|uniref:Defective in cullin neddylation protein n=1 Tax=Mucor ambiguus TaxID=91626 RepID=A0A0C9M6I0_9FUNG|nr:DCN1-like protein 4-like isoform X1 [Mucor ambiguus]
MPPKRKASTSDATLLTRKLKIQKKKKPTAQQKAELDKRTKWFQQYADKDDSSIIPPDGCQKLFGDLGVSLESATPIIVGWKLGAATMGYITKEQWINTMESISVTTPTDFKKVLHDWELQVSQDSLQFKQLYLFTFNYVKSASQKSMEVEMAIALWHILLEHTYPIVKSFIQFIQVRIPDFAIAAYAH